MTGSVPRASAEYEGLAPLFPDDFSDPGDDLDAVRAKFAAVHGHDPGPGVVVESAPSGKGVWVRPEAHEPRGTVFFVHGGGFVTSDAASYSFYGAAVVRATGWQTFIAEYPLAPESVFPAQLEALAEAFAADVAAVDGPVVLMGDSCGGGMAVALAIRERPVRTRASGIVSLCGWFDLLATGASATHPLGRDPFLDPDWLRRRGRDYVGSDGDPAHPEASVVHADLVDLPPMLLHAGQVDRCRSDAEAVAMRAAVAEVAVDLRIWPAMPHGFHGMAGVIPEADAALREVRDWLDRVVAGSRQLRSPG